MLRVVVIDDSPVARDLISEILNSEDDIQVVGVAADGQSGVELVTSLQPDVVTMDVQMPRMDGYQATREIMIAQPTPIVVVSGSSDSPDVEKSMLSLQAGALTVVGKPHAPTSSKFEQAAAQLVDTIRTMSAVKVVRHRRHPTENSDHASVKCPAVFGAQAVKVIAIAASTGGPQTVHRILTELPADFPIPILYVQHISDGFGEGLANWLHASTELDVRIARDGEKLNPGTVYLAAEGRHLEVSEDARIVLRVLPPVGGFRPSAGILFESVAKAFGRNSLAIILTGMGRDGVDGLKAVRQLGGRVLAQDQESCVVFGMPRAAIEEELHDAIVNPLQIIDYLKQLQADKNSGHGIDTDH